MKRSGFTLIELLVVIAIIAVLFGLLVPILGTVFDNMNNARIEKLINADLKLALTTYYDEVFSYPPGPQNNPIQGIENVVAALDGDATTVIPAYNTPTKRYFEFSKEDLLDSNTNNRDEICDPWQHPVKYINWHEVPTASKPPTAHNREAYDMWSFGSDEQENTDDDVKNWED